ncbi:MAG: DegT/DnrJ/EryC1/StrS family aminotransferase [Hyphomicrobiaceae bacterium]|jgi:perosamine synthetase|nr:DegT/DnrJ/EryC1/StrS family aminotransferase [Hyphomicrobiaceae bacterium]
MNEMSPVTVEEITFPSDQDSSGRTFGQEEIDLLTKVIQSGTLTATKGTMVKDFADTFAKMVGAKYAYACASGTAALHAAIAAVDPKPGDEIITTSITDMGAITPILYQGAIPVFADVDPVTMNVTPETIAKVISPKTKAIMVTHLFGNPAELAKIKALADKHKLALIEDCAQAFMAKENGRFVGTVGDVGCFSLQQGKHITAGEGGIVVTNDENVARRLRLFIDKAWGYGDPKPDHYFLAINYRMTELAGAVGLAQLGKLQFSVDQRRKMADRLSSQLEGLEGITLPVVADDAEHTYWRYCIMVDPTKIEGGPVALAGKLKAYNVASGPRYIQKPAFECQVLRDQVTFGDSKWPFTLARPEAVDYAPANFPGTYKALNEVLVLPWNERYVEKHIDHIAGAIRAQHKTLLKG